MSIQEAATMIDSQRAPGLHLHGDIPVVEVEGEWDDSTADGIRELIQWLANAGHLDIIVNLTHVAPSLTLDCKWIESLERMAATMRKHFGRLDIVGTLAQSQQYLRCHATSRLLWAATEEEAIGHIKGLPVFRRGPILTTRTGQPASAHANSDPDHRAGNSVIADMG